MPQEDSDVPFFSTLPLEVKRVVQGLRGVEVQVLNLQKELRKEVLALELKVVPHPAQLTLADHQSQSSTLQNALHCTSTANESLLEQKASLPKKSAWARNRVKKTTKTTRNCQLSRVAPSLPLRFWSTGFGRCRLTLVFLNESTTMTRLR